MFAVPELQRLQQNLLVWASYPFGGDEIPSQTSEEIFAHAIAGRRTKSAKYLFDAIRDTTGWSLKSLRSSLRHGTELTVVLHRIPSTMVPLDSTAEAGSKILDRWYGVQLESRKVQHVDDARECFLVYQKERTVYNFMLFQHTLDVIPNVQWSWNENEKGLNGYYNEKLVYIWNPAHGQLRRKISIPETAHAFSVNPCKFSPEELIEMQLLRIPDEPRLFEVNVR